MKGCAGALLGLVIGAAVAFALLTAAAVVSSGGGACTATEPVGWSLRADLPGGLISRLEPGLAYHLPEGITLTLREVEPRPCQRLVLYGDVLTRGGWRISDLGVELRLDLDAQSGVTVHPVRLWFGRLPVAVGWLPSWLTDPLLDPVNQAVNLGIQNSLRDSGLNICGLASSNSSVSIYLCPAG